MQLKYFANYADSFDTAGNEQSINFTEIPVGRKMEWSNFQH